MGAGGRIFFPSLEISAPEAVFSVLLSPSPITTVIWLSQREREYECVGWANGKCTLPTGSSECIYKVFALCSFPPILFMFFIRLTCQRLGWCSWHCFKFLYQLVGISSSTLKGCGLSPQSGHIREATDRCFPSSLSLKINKNVSSGEDLKK